MLKHPTLDQLRAMKLDGMADAFVDLSIKGDLEHPDLQGFLDLRRTIVVPNGLDQRLSIPVGRLDFTDESVTLRNLTVVMDDARASASGSIAIDHWTPGRIAAEVHGELSMRLLQWAFKEHLADVSGKLGIDVKLGGTFRQPRWTGRAEIHSTKIKLRRWEHDITAQRGTVMFVDSDIVLGCGKGAALGCKRIDGALDEQPIGIEGTLSVGGPNYFEAIDLSVDGAELRQNTSEWSIAMGRRSGSSGRHAWGVSSSVDSSQFSECRSALPISTSSSPIRWPASVAA